MYYRILLKPIDAAYRGVHRLEPSYNELEAEDSRYNLAWLHLCKTFGDIKSIDKACKFADIFNRGNAISEVVGFEVVTAECMIKPSGYDVASNKWHSMLADQIRWSDNQKLNKPLGSLLRLIEEYFSPLLNEYGLFSKYAEAEHFKDVIDSIEAVCPGTWETPGTYRPEVLSVSLEVVKP